MTAEEIGRMTLADIESLAARLGAAAATIRETQALFSAPTETPATPQPQPRMSRMAKRAQPSIELDHAEIAERNTLLKQFARDDLPPDIARAESDGGH